MNPRPPSWAHLAALARQAPPCPAAPPADLPAALAAQALRHAALAPPTRLTVGLAWLTVPKFALPLLLLVLAGAFWAGTLRLSAPDPAARYAGWSQDTLRYLRAWHPLECEDAGELAVLLRGRVLELQARPPGDPASAARLAELERELAAWLPPAARAAFLAEQARLRAKWLQP